MTPPHSWGRAVLRRRSLLGGTLALAATQACSSEPNDTTAATPEPGASSSSIPRARSRVLLASFSRAGENYYYGDRIDLDVGNTEALARIISRRLRELGVDHDVHRIAAAHPYPDDYDGTVDRNVREQEADTRPEIANRLASIDDYDTVLLASPIWNLRPPMIMRTFAESYDWAGRTVHPVTTYAMSGLGSSEREYAEACAGATVGDGLPVQGEKVRDDGHSAVVDWLKRIDLPATRAMGG